MTMTHTMIACQRYQYLYTKVIMFHKNQEFQMGQCIQMVERSRGCEYRCRVLRGETSNKNVREA